MIEIAVIAGLVAAAIVAREAARRADLRRARLRAEAMLDELAAAACATLADGSDPARSRRSARAVERYGRTRDQVAAAHSRRELDRLVARHRMRLEAIGLATRGLERARDLIAQAVLVRR